MNLIGINGFKTAGKDTAFGFVKELAVADGEAAVRLAFADKLKVLGGLALGFEFEDGIEMREPGTEPIDVESHVDHANDLKETGNISVEWSWMGSYCGDESMTDEFTSTHKLTGREYYQNLGAQARRVFGDTFWVDQVLPSVNYAHGSAPAREELAGRTGNAEWVVVTDVRYPNEAARVLDLDGEVWEIERPGLESDGHSSETPLPRELVTAKIVNDGTLDDLKRHVADNMGMFQGGGER